MEMLKLALFVLALAAATHGLGIAPNRIYISYVDPNNGNWTSPASNWATEETVPREELLPSTLDDVLINNHNEVVVTLRSPNKRFIRSLTIGSGNTLVIGTNSELTAGPPTESPVGQFVDSCDGLPTQCPVDWVQSKENQAFCISCALTSQVANADQSECVFCPAGKVFNGTLDAGMRCQNCSMFQDSDGAGSECRDCPAHFSSFGGEPCFPCPPPTDSHTGGPCVLCLPDLREEYCPWGFSGTGECSGEGTCVEGLDPVTLAERQICACDDESAGPNCGITNDSGFVVRDCGFGDCQVTIPFPFGFTRATPTGPILYLTFEAIGVAYKSAYRLNTAGTDFGMFGLQNPYTSPPAGFEATIFSFELFVWDSFTNAPVQEVYSPIRVTVPYDELDELANPWALELFYWNAVQSEWIQVSRTCFGENKRQVDRFGFKQILTQQGLVEFELYQASAQFAVFKALPGTTEIPGNPPGVLAPNPLTPNTGNGFSNNFNGEARPPHITTGIAGVLPVPPVADPGRRPLEPERRPLFTASSASATSVSFAFACIIVMFNLFL